MKSFFLPQEEAFFYFQALTNYLIFKLIKQI